MTNVSFKSKKVEQTIIYKAFEELLKTTKTK